MCYHDPYSIYISIWYEQTIKACEVTKTKTKKGGIKGQQSVTFIKSDIYKIYTQ